MHIEILNIDSELKALLQHCELPIDDLADSHARNFFGIRHNGQLVACVGIEPYADVGLLRSLAVASDHRHKSLGAFLLNYAEDNARNNGVKTLYLLTSMASAYFSARGYGLADRQRAPQVIKTTAQFAGLCPASATFMKKRLNGG
jgi:amino-acid N-acetyltransferase